MSFEGYYEYIAEDGTYWCEDVYEASLSPVSSETGSPAKWVHLVDETNGVNKDDPDTYPAPKVQYVDIEVLDIHYDQQILTRYAPHGEQWRALNVIDNF